ncbi:MAG: Smr/MutS family protein [Chloroflexi bacterium]|nr:Smr/MutS family protein [Chloroflexota bacterium]
MVPIDDLDPMEFVAPPDDDRTIANNARISRSRGGSRGGAGGASDGGGGVGVGTLRLDRARTVASSLDIRGARVDEALDALDRYLDDAGLAGLEQVIVIHGSGTGALRDAVRQRATAHPLVSSFRAGERGERGDGATIVKL